VKRFWLISREPNEFKRLIIAVEIG
jgi:hypothetical protein